MAKTFKALLLQQEPTIEQPLHLSDIDEGQLGQGDVLVAIEHSSLNYKDAVALTGRGKIIRAWPMVPGIDLAGRVMQSADPRFAAGDPVLCTGYGLGECYPGGYSQRQRLPADWLVKMPSGMDASRAMALGTAGLTAMLCVQALIDAGVEPGSGPVLVTGASGGVGGVAVILLARLGYAVTALSGRPEHADYLIGLGASDCLDRKAWNAQAARPLESQKWVGAVDVAGGKTLARVLAETRYGGCVAACGLVDSHELPTTLMPFILRNVRLQGCDSVMTPAEPRQQAWDKLAELTDWDKLQASVSHVSLEQVPEVARQLLDGELCGRVVVDC